MAQTRFLESAADAMLPANAAPSQQHVGKQSEHAWRFWENLRHTTRQTNQGQVITQGNQPTTARHRLRQTPLSCPRKRGRSRGNGDACSSVQRPDGTSSPQPLKSGQTSNIRQSKSVHSVLAPEHILSQLFLSKPFKRSEQTFDVDFEVTISSYETVLDSARVLYGQVAVDIN